MTTHVIPFINFAGNQSIMIFRILSRLNKILLPSYIHRDLTKLTKLDQAIIAWKLWVTKNALGK